MYLLLYKIIYNICFIVQIQSTLERLHSRTQQ